MRRQKQRAALRMDTYCGHDMVHNAPVWQLVQLSASGIYPFSDRRQLSPAPRGSTERPPRLAAGAARCRCIPILFLFNIPFHYRAPSGYYCLPRVIFIPYCPPPAIPPKIRVQRLSVQATAVFLKDPIRHTWGS